MGLKSGQMEQSHARSSKSQTNKGCSFLTAHPVMLLITIPPTPAFFLLLIQLGLCLGAFPPISRRSTYTGLWFFSAKMVIHHDSKHEKFQPKCRAGEGLTCLPWAKRLAAGDSAPGRALGLPCSQNAAEVRGLRPRAAPVSHRSLLLSSLRWPGRGDIHRRAANPHHADRRRDSHGLQ